MKELIEVIKANPGKYSFAAPGVGSTPHLSGEIFRARLRPRPRPRCSSPAPARLSNRRVGGHTPVAFSALPPAAPQIKEGTLRALAVTAEKRSSALPEVPTMAEAGIDGQEAYTLTGILAPAATPKEIIDLLHREIVEAGGAARGAASASPTWASTWWPIRPTSSRHRSKRKCEKWAKVIRDAKIKVEGAH